MLNNCNEQVLVDGDNMIITYLKNNESVIIIPDTIQNINILASCFRYQNKTRILYSIGVKKIRIVVFFRIDVDNTYLICELLENLPPTVTDLIFGLCNYSQNKQCFKKYFILKIESQLAKIKIPFGCKITFEYPPSRIIGTEKCYIKSYIKKLYKISYKKLYKLISINNI
jgi:hypothetical protein